MKENERIEIEGLCAKATRGQLEFALIEAMDVIEGFSKEKFRDFVEDFGHMVEYVSFMIEDRK